MKVEKQISLKIQLDVYNYLKKLSEEKRTTISLEIRNILFESYNKNNENNKI